MKKYYSIWLILSCLNLLNGTAQSLLINEFQSKNAFTVTDDFGEYDDWIEIKNLTSQEINLNGYFISDDWSMKSKFQLSSSGDELIIPAGGYLILWADDDESQGADHLSFNISGNAGLIALFSPSLQMIDSINYAGQYMDVSMGRVPEFPYSWKFFQHPTPGQQNTSQSFSGVLQLPGFNKVSGFYNTAIDVTIYPSRLSDSIYYTLNNTTPHKNSPLFQGALPLENTKVINAIESGYGFINSHVASEVYIFRPAFTLPVLAVLTDSLNLFGDQGIYTNYDEPWEKFCQIRYLSNGISVAESNAGIRIQGASSTYMPKKSFRLFFRSDYGDSKFQYPVFGTKYTGTFDKLVLKSGYDDDITTETGTLLRDALAIEFWNKLGGLKQLSSWIILYLNNRYWGIYNLRESIDENFIAEHTGLTDFDLIRFRNEGPETVYGSITNWNTMFDQVKNTDLAVADNYQNLAENLDMDDFINLMAFIQCTEYYSWSWGISMYHENNAAGRWKVTIWDADRAFNDYEWNGFQEAIDKTYDLYWANIFPKNLIENSTFKQKYANRLHELLETVFKPENAVAVLDSLNSIIAPEMDEELARWAPQNDQWENNVEKIREFLRRRPGIVTEQMKDYLPMFSGSDESVMPPQYLSVFPNPSDEQVVIQYSLITKGRVDLSVYDQEGRLVKNLYSGVSDLEENTVIWRGDSESGLMVPSGLYIIRMITEEGIVHTKILRK